MSHRSGRTPHHLTTTVKAMAHGVRMVWGPPVAVARMQYAGRKDYRMLCEWILWFERLVRALVCWMALGCLVRGGVSAPALRPSQPRPRARTLALQWPDRPSSWVARFSMVPFSNGDPRGPKKKPPPPDANRRPPPRWFSTWRLAVRYEACMRVLADPRIRARAFALRLARLKAANARRNAPIDIAARVTPPWIRPARRPERDRNGLVLKPWREFPPAVQMTRPAWSDLAARITAHLRIWLEPG